MSALLYITSKCARRGRSILAVPRELCDEDFEYPCLCDPGLSWCSCRPAVGLLGLSKPIAFPDREGRADTHVFSDTKKHVALREDWHETEEAAHERVKSQAAARIRYLKGEIRRLEKLVSGDAKLPIAIARDYSNPCQACGGAECSSCHP